MTPIRSILILLCYCSAATAQCYLQAPPPVVRVANAVKGACSYGTGTVLHDDGSTAIVVTSWHLVRDDGVGTLSVYDHVGKRWIQGTRLAEAPANELFALRVRSFGSGAIAIADAEPAVGDPVVAGGYGTDGTYRACTGQVRAVRGIRMDNPDGQDNAFTFSGAARQGDSGGPILNTAGKICGLLWGTLNGERYGTRLPIIRAFLCRILAPRVAPPSVLPGPGDDKPVLPLPLPPRSSVDINTLPLSPIESPDKQPVASNGAAAARDSEGTQSASSDSLPFPAKPSTDLAATARDALGAALPWLIYAAMGVTGIGLPIGASALAAKGIGAWSRWRRVKAAAQLARAAVGRAQAIVHPEEPSALVGLPNLPIDYAKIWADHFAATSGNPAHEALKYHLYREAVKLLREGKICPQANGPSIAEALDDWVLERFFQRVPKAPQPLGSENVYHEALLGFLCRDAVDRLRRGEIQVLGYRETADAIDRWVRREFAKRVMLPVSPRRVTR